MFRNDLSLYFVNYSDYRKIFKTKVVGYKTCNNFRIYVKTFNVP
jgi:hypothetical protein